MEQETKQEEVKQPEQPQKKSVWRTHFTAPRMAYMAIFTALAFVVTFLEFPIFPQASFLKFDFANVFFLIEGFMFGPVEAVVSIVLKELLCFTKSSTGGVGEIANLLMSTAYVLVPSVAYRFKRGKWWVCLYLARCLRLADGGEPSRQPLHKFSVLYGRGRSCAVCGALDVRALLQYHQERGDQRRRVFNLQAPVKIHQQDGGKV